MGTEIILSPEFLAHIRENTRIEIEETEGSVLFMEHEKSLTNPNHRQTGMPDEELEISIEKLKEAITQLEGWEKELYPENQVIPPANFTNG